MQYLLDISITEDEREQSEATGTPRLFAQVVFNNFGAAAAEVSRILRKQPRRDDDDDSVSSSSPARQNEKKERQEKRTYVTGISQGSRTGQLN